MCRELAGHGAPRLPGVAASPPAEPGRDLMCLMANVFPAAVTFITLNRVFVRTSSGFFIALKLPS